MRAVHIEKPGGPEVLKLIDRPVPEPGPGEVLLKVAAAGVNRPDVLQRKGVYPPPPGASDLPGLEVAGVIEKLGPGAVGQVGAHAMALIAGGGYAEYAVVHHRHLLTLPEEMPFERAAALPETIYTVWTNVFEDGRLKEGETLFVHGATSGIGTMALSMAKAFGATVYGTAGSDEKCRAAETLGFVKCFNYRNEEWAKLMTAEGGADVVLDMVGGDYVAKDMTLLKPQGRHVSIAFQAGMEAKIPIPILMQKRLTLTGSTLRARDIEEKARLTDQIRQHVMPKIVSGEIAAVFDRAFPLEEAATAHRRMEAGEHIGKIVLLT
ncbi:NAD(P)H-quinone oxidoreductase [Parvularcula marina]|uniref:NAD(P)H-quinone oxidoreductase n=1 Tax=Parvularcula marina TaxID=2292771 RepID=UPI00351465B2